MMIRRLSRGKSTNSPLVYEFRSHLLGEIFVFGQPYTYVVISMKHRIWFLAIESNILDAYLSE